LASSVPEKKKKKKKKNKIRSKKLKKVGSATTNKQKIQKTRKRYISLKERRRKEISKYTHRWSVKVTGIMHFLRKTSFKRITNQHGKFNNAHSHKLQLSDQSVFSFATGGE